jgi:hypothetical protein
VFRGSIPPLKIAAKIGHRQANFALEIGYLARRPEREHGGGRVATEDKKMCAARGGRRVAAHE